MRIDRLFHVLVVMSGTSALTACDSKDDRRDERREDHPDAAVDAADSTADGATSTPDGGEAAPCFCDTQTCCDRSSGTPHVLDGFECCWSTTCP